MSIFDVIKYPISIPPTKEELHALPDKIIINWFNAVNHSEGPGSLGSGDALILTVSENFIRHIDLPRLTILRKIIREYDEPV